MDRCPVELWLKIVALACTDGGYTGRSLSLVSRSMRDIVEPVRFLSVSLIDEKQLLAFSGLVAHFSHPPVIQHLFVSVQLIFWGHEAMSAEKVAELEHAFNATLYIAAPNVQTLVIHDPPNFDATCNDLLFPALRDLSIPTLSQFGPELDGYTRFPSLRRLHLSSYHCFPDFWPKLVRFVPSLTHLRLSGINKDSSISPFLRILLDVPPPKRLNGTYVMGRDDQYAPGSAEANEATTVASKLSALEAIYVQPLEYRNSGWCGTGSIMHGQMKSGLRGIARDYSRVQGARELFLLPDALSYNVEEARRDWLEMVESGAGPWSDRPAKMVGGATSTSLRPGFSGEERGAYEVPPPQPTLVKMVSSHMAVTFAN